MSQDSSQEENRYDDFMSDRDLLEWLTRYDLSSPSVSLLTPETNKLVVAQPTQPGISAVLTWY